MCQLTEIKFISKREKTLLLGMPCDFSVFIFTLKLMLINLRVYFILLQRFSYLAPPAGLELGEFN